MGPTFRSKLSYANVVATLALFVALGGSSYAAGALSKNSVKSKHIGKGQVKRPDIGRNAVNSGKIKDFSLSATDFKAGQLPAGPKGDPGAPGAPGLARIAVSILNNGTIFRGSLEGGSVRRAATGQYCFDLPFTPAAAVASRFPNVTDQDDRDTVVTTSPGIEVTCLASEELLVTVLEIDENDNGTIDNTFVDRAFSLMVN
jgi:hypothetical protein